MKEIITGMILMFTTFSTIEFWLWFIDLEKTKQIKITTIYREIIIRKEIKRNKIGILTDKGFIPFEDIESIEIIGEIVENKK